MIERAILFGGMILVGLIAVARAEEVGIDRCGDVRKLATTLSDEFGEEPAYIGLTGDPETSRRMMVVFVNQQSGTFTVISKDGGKYCLVATGGKWQPIGPQE
jgi:hypothetical protein